MEIKKSLHASELGYWHYGYCVAVFLYGTLIIVGHDGEIAAFQFTCTFHDAVNLALSGLGAAHVIAHLHQTFICAPLRSTKSTSLSLRER